MKNYSTSIWVDSGPVANVSSLDWRKPTDQRPNRYDIDPSGDLYWRFEALVLYFDYDLVEEDLGRTTLGFADVTSRVIRLNPTIIARYGDVGYEYVLAHEIGHMMHAVTGGIFGNLWATFFVEAVADAVAFWLIDRYVSWEPSKHVLDRFHDVKTRCEQRHDEVVEHVEACLLALDQTGLL